MFISKPLLICLKLQLHVLSYPRQYQRYSLLNQISRGSPSDSLVLVNFANDELISYTVNIRSNSNNQSALIIVFSDLGLYNYFLNQLLTAITYQMSHVFPTFVNYVQS